MGIIINHIDMNDYHKIKKEIDKNPEFYDGKIKKITQEEILQEIANGAKYNIRGDINNLRKEINEKKGN